MSILSKTIQIFCIIILGVKRAGLSFFHVTGISNNLLIEIYRRKQQSRPFASKKIAKTVLKREPSPHPHCQPDRNYNRKLIKSAGVIIIISLYLPRESKSLSPVII